MNGNTQQTQEDPERQAVTGEQRRLTPEEARSQSDTWEALERVLGIPIAEYSQPIEAGLGLSVGARLYMIDYRPDPELCGFYVRYGITRAGSDMQDAPLHHAVNAETAKRVYSKMDMHRVEVAALDRYIEELNMIGKAIGDPGTDAA